MGALTFDVMKEYVKLRAGNRADLEAAGDSSLNYYGIWINSAYRQLCTQQGVLGLKKNLYFPQLMTSMSKTTTDGTVYVAVPTGALYITDIFDKTHGRKLKGITWDTYISYTDRTTAASEGDPTEWTRYGTYVYLHPTPKTTSDELVIYYKKLVTDLSGSLTTEIGAEWDDAIVELATHKMFLFLHEYDKAKVCKEAFLEMSVGLVGIYSLEDKDIDAYFEPSSAYMG
jgi:hypothetical protein